MRSNNTSPEELFGLSENVAIFHHVSFAHRFLRGKFLRVNNEVIDC